MNQKIVYELDVIDLKKVIADELKDLIQISVLDQFSRKLIRADTAADILGVHRETLIRYVKAGMIDGVKEGRLWKFQLSYILSINMYELKKKRHFL